VTARAERPAVLALVRDRDAAARVTEALRPGVPGAPPQAGAAVRCVTQVRALAEALAARPYALVIVEARDADGVPTEEAVRALRARHPDVRSSATPRRAPGSRATPWRSPAPACTSS
jgi:hypothetical protein